MLKSRGELWRQKIENRVARMRIFSSRNESGRFIQHDCNWLIDVNKFAVHFHVIAGRRLCVELGANLAVDGDSAR